MILQPFQDTILVKKLAAFVTRSLSPQSARSFNFLHSYDIISSTNKERALHHHPLSAIP
jgi:hypothetical protein